MSKTASSAVYLINYHFVWCPKYRKKILTDSIAIFVEEQIKQIASCCKYEIIEMYVMPDHIHLFVRCNPFESPVNIVKRFKAVTAILAFRKFPELRHKMWKGVLWSPSYYVGTAGHVSSETIARYIREQESDSSAGLVRRSSRRV